MKGVILAGGLGSRLYPLTRITNKHLLSVFDRPMIRCPIQCLANAAIKDILIVTGGSSAGDFIRLLGSGKEFDLKELHYIYQENEEGIADALKLAEDFADRDKIVAVLGDNIIEKNICRAARAFSARPAGARLLLKEVNEPQRFGVARFEGGRLVAIEEKPEHPPSSYAVTGIYMYDSWVFDVLSRLEPSARGELEITDVNNAYIDRDNARWWQRIKTGQYLKYYEQQYGKGG